MRSHSASRRWIGAGSSTPVILSAGVAPVGHRWAGPGVARGGQRPGVHVDNGDIVDQADYDRGSTSMHL